MKLNPAHQRGSEPTVATLVAIEGTATAAWPAALIRAGAQRDLTDTIHALCTMYGAYPGLIDTAIDRGEDSALRRWLEDAAIAFTLERGHLAALVAATGPLPSTPRQAQTEAAIAAQRHALDMLARSDRAGCAIGAATALVLDWHAVRTIVAVVADRAGMDLPPSLLPADEPAESGNATIDRARLFGARQLLAQQRGLWDLLQARSEARGSH